MAGICPRGTARWRPMEEKAQKHWETLRGKNGQHTAQKKLGDKMAGILPQHVADFEETVGMMLQSGNGPQ